MMPDGIRHFLARVKKVHYSIVEHIFWFFAAYWQLVKL